MLQIRVNEAFLHHVLSDRPDRVSVRWVELFSLFLELFAASYHPLSYQLIFILKKYHLGGFPCVLCKANYICNLFTAWHLHTNRTTVHQNSTDAVLVSHILLVTCLCLCVPNLLALGADSLSSHCDVSHSKKHNLGLFFWVGAAGNVDSNAINSVAHNTCSWNQTFSWASHVCSWQTFCSLLWPILKQATTASSEYKPATSEIYIHILGM